MAGTVNTDVDMANLALAHLKEPGIQAFDYSSKAGRWFKANYAAKRDAFLAKHDWDFAMKLTALAADTQAPPFRWEYQYSLPADCLRVPRQTEDGGRNGRFLDYEVIGRKLMSDAEAPFYLRYVRRVESEAEFSPLFVDAFAFFLAGSLAHVITGKNSFAQTLLRQAEIALDDASLTDAMQSSVQPAAETGIVAIR